MLAQHSVQSSSSSATDKMFEFQVKLLLVAVIASFSVDAVQFDCIFTFVSPGHIGSVYICFPNVTLSESKTLENVTGVHQSGYTNDDVKYLRIHDQNLPFVPKGIVNFFKNLKAISYKNTNMLSISAEDLKPFPQLELFQLDGSKVTTLDGDLFKFTPLLKIVYLDFNKIQHIGQDLVTNLNNLHFLSLQGNICIDKLVYSRAAVVTLAAQLSVLCPPLDLAGTVRTTVTLTNTELLIELCSCHDEIEELRKEILQQSNDQQNQAISQLIQANEKLFELNNAVEKRLLEVEMKLREISSNS